MTTVESLYYQLHNCFLDGAVEKANMYAHFLIDEMSKNKIKYDDFLSPRHVKNAENIVPNALKNSIIENKEPAYRFEEIRLNKNIRTQTEDQLKQLIFNNPDAINKAWGKDIVFKNWEDVTDNGKVDMLYMDKDDQTIIPIELKDEVADHDVVTQILKYTIYYKKLYIYRLWDWVQPAVIAAGYDKYAVNHLKMENVRMFLYSYTDKLTIEEAL